MLIKFFKQSWLLMVTALFFGLLMAAVYGQLEGKIKENARLKLDREMKALLGEQSTFQPVKDKDSKEVLYYVAKQGDKTVGYAIAVVGSGFADKVGLLVALDASLDKLLGIAVLKSNETPGFGDKIKEPEFRDQFRNCPAQKKLVVVKTGDRSVSDREIVAITGATISSEATTKIVNDAVIKLRNLVKAKGG